MKMGLIWQRYFVKETVKVTSLFLLCFFFLFFLFDYTSRAGSLLSGELPLGGLFLYYLLIFLRHVDILLPFALMLATIKVLTGLNGNNELVALLAGGIPMKRLLRPFLLVGVTGCALMYFNFQLLIPNAIHKLRRMEDTYFNESNRDIGVGELNDFTLYDGSLVLYRNFDTAREMFSDVYWIRSLDDVYRMKQLYPDPHFTVGRMVDHLARVDSGELELRESLETRVFSEMQLDDDLLEIALMTPEELSLTQLWQRLPQHSSGSKRESESLTWFYKRLAMPWACLLAVIAPAPFCIRHSRNQRVFFIYVLGLLGMVTFHLLLDSALVAGEAQILSPLLAISIPFLLLGGFSVPRYFRVAH